MSDGLFLNVPCDSRYLVHPPNSEFAVRELVAFETIELCLRVGPTTVRNSSDNRGQEISEPRSEGYHSIFLEVFTFHHDLVYQLADYTQKSRILVLRANIADYRQK